MSRLWPLVVGELPTPSMAAHVADCSRCQQRVDHLRQDVAALRESLWEGQVGPHREPEAPPKQIGDYLILSPLGGGGQATVYRAWHPRLRIDVVVKWFRSSAPWIVDPERLATEAALLGAIRHPYLGRVFDIGIEQGRPYLVMEYVRGKTFAEWVRSERPSPARIATLLAKAAEGVYEVHRFGALHLDLKPQNILVDEQGDPRVIDFGMARLAERRAGSAPQWVSGTPEYMSPEQCVGDADLISTRSDVYGLGAVLFWAIAERPPRAVDEMRAQVSMRGLAPAPWGLRVICRKSLALRPRERFRSCRELADELFRFVAFQALKYRIAAVLVGLVGMLSCLASVWSPTGGGPLAQARVELTASLGRRDRPETPMKLRSAGTDPLRVQTVVATAYAPAFVAAQNAVSDHQYLGDSVHAAAVASFRVNSDTGMQLYVACYPGEWKFFDHRKLIPLLKSMEHATPSGPLRIEVDETEISLIEPQPTDLDENPDEALRWELLGASIQSVLSEGLTEFHAVIVVPPRPVDDLAI